MQAPIAPGRVRCPTEKPEVVADDEVEIREYASCYPLVHAHDRAVIVSESARDQ